MAWFTTTYIGKLIVSILVSMVPVIELRGGIPIAVALGLDPVEAMIACIIGNMLPIPFILIFLERFLIWMKNWGGIFSKAAIWLEERAEKKGKALERGLILGLIILVAIPLPGTGAWTGALVASVLKIPVKKSIPAIFVGVIIAALIVILVTYGVAALI
ncbi:MAG: small multi-drug export protein [Oscillospiraceae bacterium]|nr:small multi-drug export protein [Oscillospiraceae bacterium]